ncbi:hypothetical protein ACU4HD_43850 [Cupriavidus basilensis]
MKHWSNTKPVLTVRIAPQQVADLERVLGTMTDGTRRVRVVPDASLSEEALVVETASGVVEAGIDTQLAALHAALVRSGNMTEPAVSHIIDAGDLERSLRDVLGRRRYGCGRADAWAHSPCGGAHAQCIGHPGAAGRGAELRTPGERSV